MNLVRPKKQTFNCIRLKNSNNSRQKNYLHYWVFPKIFTPSPEENLRPKEGGGEMS